ncbi:MAG TPA: glycine zipper family protein [Aliidongia sp.]|nr:glycine zipper family protein [Aliidongia sp.]
MPYMPSRAIALIVLLLAGCVTQPTGPTIAVMPAPYKPFDVFQQEDFGCRQYAAYQVAGGAEQANAQALGTAALTTGLGAALGAVAGAGRGAAIGAASGAVVGTAVGTGPSARSQYGLQWRYDLAYEQCMYSKGNQVPGFPLPPLAAPPPR